MHTSNTSDFTYPSIESLQLACKAFAMDIFELHGSLSGWLAGGGKNTSNWLAEVLADANIPSPEAGCVLDQLYQATAAQLTDDSYSFELLEPDAEQPIGIRAEALFEWCRGFLGGFGLAVGSAKFLSKDSQELLYDLLQLATSAVSEEEDEEAENALSELHEYVKIAVLSLYSDCVLVGKQRKHLH